MAYTTTLDLANFMGIVKSIPNRELVGESRVREEVGTGDSSTTVFYLDNAYVIASTYTFQYGATESGSLNTLTETTHYTLDKDLGKLTLTASGVTAVGTNKIFASYSYTSNGITNTQLDDAISRAEEEVDRFTNNHFAVSSDATPDWNQVTEEKQMGKGPYDRNYFTLQHYPIPNVSTQLNGAVSANDSTITVDSTAGFPSAGYLSIGDDKIQYTGKSGTTFTGCTSVSAHSDNDYVYPWVVEISTTEPGGSIVWDVLEINTEYDLDRSTGRVHIYADGTDYFGSYVDIESSPLKSVANRFRVTYPWGNSTIPVDIEKATLMLAARDIMSLMVRKAHSTGLNDFNPSLLDVDKAELDRLLMAFRNEQFMRV